MISDKLDEIASYIASYVENGPALQKNGLYSGDFGILLFLYHYADYSKEEKYASLADSFTDELLGRIASGLNIYTYCSGLSGILYMLDFLKQRKMLEVDLGEAEDILDKQIAHSMRQDLNRGYYDFLHGALGAGIYFLRKGKLAFVHECIDFLYNTVDRDEEGKICKWKSVLDIKTGRIGYNISLSHGMSSIAIFLSRAVASGLQHPKLQELLTGLITYLLSQRQDPTLYGTYFPSYSQDVPGPSRLGWCYGDMGVALAIYQASKVCRNDIWMQQALEVLLGTTQRTADNGRIEDAGICHGSVGVAMIYRRMYLDTGNEVFLSAFRRWVQETLQFSVYEDGLAGYKMRLIEDWVNDYSLLTGISGVGMFFLSYLKEDAQEWDELFLLS